MKNYRFFQFLISLFLMGNSVSLLAQDIPGIDGWGTASDPIIINWAQGTSPLQKLNKISKWVNKDASGVDGWRNNWTSTNKHFKLEADISGFTNMIGTEASQFCGIFDGNGHMITVNINKPTIGCVGLFGSAAGATITRLTVAGNVRGAYGVAGLLGQGGNTTVTFCTNVADVIVKDANGNGYGYAAGIAATTCWWGSLIIQNCVNAGTIEALWNVGGIVGDGFDQATVISCINIGTIRGLSNDGWVGGIVGREPYLVENCMNAGFVYSNGGYVGGIVGFYRKNRAVRNCLNTGVVHASQPAGAIVGYMPDYLLLQNNYYDKQMCTKGGVGGNTTNTFATGLSTEELTDGYWHPFGTQWQLSGTNFYPIPTGGIAGVGNVGYNAGLYSNDHVSKVASASIKLQSLPIPPFPETTDNIIVHSFYAYHPVNSGVNRWTARNGSIIFAPPHTWYTSGQARKDTMVATCGTYSKLVPLNIPYEIRKLAAETNFATNAFSIGEVTPNIVTDNATIDIQTATEGNLNISIYDLAGTKVANVTDRYIDANTSLQVDLNNLSNLSTGSYMAVVSVGNEVVMRKFIKQ